MTQNVEHYRNGLAFGLAYARNYGKDALLRAVRNPQQNPSLSTSARDYHVGVIDAALALFIAERS